MVHSKSLLWSAALAASLCGCGGSDFPPTTPVSGTVTYKGQPVEGAAVTLVPTSPSGKAATATTDAQGNFKIRTFQEDDGAVAGQYQVTVSKMVAIGAISAEEAQRMMEADQVVPETKYENKVPEKYRDPKKSGLTADVADSDVTLTLELTD